MKRRFALVVALLLVVGFALMSIAQAAPPKDPIGCVAIKKGQPIHIAYWMVVAGENASLGTDTRRGVEIAPAGPMTCSAAWAAGSSGGPRPRSRRTTRSTRPQTSSAAPSAPTMAISTRMRH